MVILLAGIVAIVLLACGVARALIKQDDMSRFGADYMNNYHGDVEAALLDADDEIIRCYDCPDVILTESDGEQDGDGNWRCLSCAAKLERETQHEN
jgi:hypothetical protein